MWVGFALLLLVIELIDPAEKVEKLTPILDEMLGDGPVTTERGAGVAVRMESHRVTVTTITTARW